MINAGLGFRNGQEEALQENQGDALEDLVVVVNRVTCFVPVLGSILYVHPVTSAVPYLLTGLT
jgi:hypothetical protein